MRVKTVGLIDGQSGNIGSIKKAIRDIIKNKPYRLKIINSSFNIENFDRIILPGQGAYATLMSNLKKLNIYKSLKKYFEINSPYLGICVGMQILSDTGFEDKITEGFGVIPGQIKRFKNKKLIIPHMGWNNINVKKKNSLIDRSLDRKDFYFVHSYFFENISALNVLAVTKYGKNFPSIVSKGNIYGVQFHPEKSHKNGIKLIKNFIINS